MIRLAGQLTLGHRELVSQQVLFLAQGLVNELAQVVQRVDEDDANRRQCLLVLMEATSEGKNELIGVASAPTSATRPPRPKRRPPATD